jgi:hypothetical protein
VRLGETEPLLLTEADGEALLLAEALAEMELVALADAVSDALAVKDGVTCGREEVDGRGGGQLGGCQGWVATAEAALCTRQLQQLGKLQPQPQLAARRRTEGETEAEGVVLPLTLVDAVTVGEIVALPLDALEGVTDLMTLVEAVKLGEAVTLSLTVVEGVTDRLTLVEAVKVGEIVALPLAAAEGVFDGLPLVEVVRVGEIVTLSLIVVDAVMLAAVTEGVAVGEALGVPLRETLTEAEKEGSGAQSPAPSTAASCAPPSALSHRRTSVKAPGQAICPVKDWPPRKGALPHMAPAEDWLCGGAQAAVELATHCAAAALSKYRLSVNRLPPGSGASVSASVCQRPSERLPAALAQSAVPP